MARMATLTVSPSHRRSLYALFSKCRRGTRKGDIPLREFEKAYDDLIAQADSRFKLESDEDLEAMSKERNWSELNYRLIEGHLLHFEVWMTLRALMNSGRHSPLRGLLVNRGLVMRH